MQSTHIEGLTSRNGLKEVHARFESVAKKLEATYIAAWGALDIPTLSAVIAVWSEMCADVLLCRKLLERGEPGLYGAAALPKTVLRQGCSPK